jgi:hypothetical protein
MVGGPDVVQPWMRGAADVPQEAYRYFSMGPNLGGG